MSVFLQETTHQYFHEESGKELLAVTTVFEKNGVTDFSKVPFNVIEPARVKGELVHEMAALYGRGMLDEESIDVSLFGYFEAIEKFFRDEVKKVIVIENTVHNLTHGYAGTLDIAYLNHKNLVCIDDYKSALKPHKACKWQTAAYAYAFEKLYKIKVQQRQGVHFTDSGDYSFDEHNNSLRRDFNDFMTLLKTAQLKMINKIN